MTVNFNVKDTFLEAYEKGYQDPEYFVNNFLDREVHPSQLRWMLGGRPYAKQRCWAAANRIGKTTIAGYELVRRAFYQVRDPEWAVDARTGRLREYIVMSIAMSLDQARLAWNIAVTCIQESPKMRPFLQDIKDTPFPLFTLATGKKGDDRALSEVWARSTAKRARYLLGRRINFINWDECAWDPDGKQIFDEVIKMRLVDQGGEIDFTSTPNAKNWFYEQYQLGEYGTPMYGGKLYYSQTGMSIENPYLPKKALKQTARHMSRDMIRQNIFGEFIEMTTIFTWEDVARCYYGQEYSLPVRPGYYTEYKNDEEADYIKYEIKKLDGRYVVGVDLGRKQDPTCIIVLRVDIEPAQIHAFKLIEKTQWDVIYDAIAETCRTYNAKAMIDATGIGDPIDAALGKEPYNVETIPFIYTPKSKENLILALQEAIQRRRIIFPYIEPLVKSLTMYKFDDRKLFTDPVMALALAWKSNTDATGLHFMGQDSLAPVIVGRRYDLVNKTQIVSPVQTLQTKVYDPLAVYWDDEDSSNIQAFESRLRGR